MTGRTTPYTRRRIGNQVALILVGVAIASVVKIVLAAETPAVRP